MIKAIKIILVVVCIPILVISCNDDDNKTDDEQDAFEGCCSPDPVFGPNINNLDQSAEDIIVDNIFTPNGDGTNDRFVIENLELYDNHTVTIYDSDDNIIFESTNYVNFEDFFPQESQGEFGIESIPDGTYKYKIVIETEETFRISGAFCLFTNNPVVEQQNFSECDPLADGGFDPLISGL